MFNRIKIRINDMKTVSRLISNAETQANALGEETAGAEHYVLSALELPDGSAKNIFSALGITTSDFKDAINKQYESALNSVGFDAEAVSAEPITNKKVLPGTHPSGKQLMKSLHALKKNDKDRPLLGAHVLEVVADIKYGVVTRVFKELDVTPENLKQAVYQELGSQH